MALFSYELSPSHILSFLISGLNIIISGTGVNDYIFQKFKNRINNKNDENDNINYRSQKKNFLTVFFNYNYLGIIYYI